MIQSVCEQLNMFFRRMLNVTQYETKDLWAAIMFFGGVLNLTHHEKKSLWSAKHVLLMSVKFSKVWDKGFVISETCSFEEW